MLFLLPAPRQFFGNAGCSLIQRADLGVPICSSGQLQLRTAERPELPGAQDEQEQPTVPPPQWMNVAREKADECFARAVCAAASPLMLTANVRRRSSPSVQPSHQACCIYSFTGWRVQQSASKGQANHQHTKVHKELSASSSPGLSESFTRAQTQRNRHTGPTLHHKAVTCDLGLEHKGCFAQVEASEHITTFGCVARHLNLHHGSEDDGYAARKYMKGEQESASESV